MADFDFGSDVDMELGLIEDLVMQHHPLTYEKAKGDQIAQTRVHEGRGSNDPVDRGGKTKFGVSTLFLNELHAVGRWKKYKTVNDIPHEDAALQIFEKEFFIPNEVNYGKNKVTLKMNDLSVHVGGPRATWMMQRALNKLYDIKILKEDGRTGKGSNTDKLYKRAVVERGVDDIVNQLALVQAQYYEDDVKTDPPQLKFLGGWLTRASYIPVW